MSYLLRQVDFAPEAFEGPWILQTFGADGLERNPLVQFQVFRFVDFTHSAASQKSRNAKSLREKFTGRKNFFRGATCRRETSTEWRSGKKAARVGIICQ